jgi:hypothetical protein
MANQSAALLSRSALSLYARLWGLLTHLRTLIDCGGDGFRWLGQSRHKCVDRGRSLVAGGGFWRLGKGYQGEDRAGRESCPGRATIAHGEGHTKIDGPAPVQPSDSPPAVKDQTSAPHASTLPAQTTSVYGRHQSVRYIKEHTRSQADTGY